MSPTPPPTITPTRALSGPTLEPSPTTDVRPPTAVLAEDQILGGPGQNIPEAAALAPDSALPPVPMGTPGATAGSQRIQLVMADGAMLSGDLYQNISTQIETTTPQPLPRYSGVLLLGVSLAEWGDFPARLRDAGYTVLAMEIRSGGGTADFSVMLRALSETATVNPALLAVIGAGEGANLALQGCAVDLLCDTAILLTPTQRDVLSSAMSGYNPRSLLIAFSAQDTAAVDTARALQLVGTGDVRLEPSSAAGSGAALLFAAPDLTGTIGLWLAETLVE
ncbi:MAG: hypothetical protein SF029_23440 [bacterium]|nr:hypothetical protein [bacterium]